MQRLTPASRFSTLAQLWSTIVTYHRTPLRLAVRSKAEFNLVRILVNHGADVECLDTQKWTPFHAFFNPTVSQLAGHCTESMDAITMDANGMTLAHYFSWTNASSPSDFQVLPNLNTLLKARDVKGRTPLHFAAQRGNIPVMEYLLSQYQNPTCIQPNRERNTPLHEAVQSSRAPAAINLLREHGFSLEQRNNEGHAAVQHAALWGTVPAMRILMSRDPGAIAWRDKDERGIDALARQTENVEVAAWLETQFGEEGTRTQSTLIKRNTRRVRAGIRIWRLVEIAITPSTGFRILVALLLVLYSPPPKL
ncbi:MAG: hypothetical protein LQ351_000253 [Letrouitia transgressa]|nr:MAG: hypothetical protein LQ351_000253 [Letrouitia transgressa]